MKLFILKKIYFETAEVRAKQRGTLSSSPAVSDDGVSESAASEEWQDSPSNKSSGVLPSNKVVLDLTKFRRSTERRSILLPNLEPPISSLNSSIRKSSNFLTGCSKRKRFEIISECLKESLIPIVTVSAGGNSNDYSQKEDLECNSSSRRRYTEPCNSRKTDALKPKSTSTNNSLLVAPPSRRGSTRLQSILHRQDKNIRRKTANVTFFTPDEDFILRTKNSLHGLQMDEVFEVASDMLAPSSAGRGDKKFSGNNIGCCI